jgi:hypothetical protein
MSDLEALIEAADVAANAKAREMERQLGHDRGACGFGWVEIPDGRSPIVREMKKLQVGSKHWKKGWMVWGPGNSRFQNVDVHAEAARAYAGVLQKAGIDARACSRLD